MEKLTVTAYTDGSCIGNPGRGGWAYIIFEETESQILKWTGSGHKSVTTNNEMEMMAILECLLHIPRGTEALIKSDSQYVLKGIASGEEFISSEANISGWMKNWKQNGWKKSGGPIKNLELWKRIYNRIVEMTNGGTRLKFVWVKGHNCDPGNEEVDRLANEAASSQ